MDGTLKSNIEKHERALMTQQDLAIRRKLISKALMVTDDGWLVMGYVLPDVCACCKHTGYDIIGKPCPTCGSMQRVGTTGEETIG